MEKLAAVFLGIIIVMGTFLFGAVLTGLPLMLLWDWLMPTIFGLTTITFWQAVGLAFLCSILFKSSASSSS